MNLKKSKGESKMKKTINGKRYDTKKMEELCSYDHFNHSNTYSGTTTLYRASDGVLLEEVWSNGQNLYLVDALNLFEEGDIDFYDIRDKEEARLVELGLITIV
jgi:hypothetical protein